MKSLILGMAFLLSTAAWGQTYQRVASDRDGKHLQLIATAGQQIQAPLLKDQVGFDQPRLAADGSRVGWLALFPNCCTSYPIPLELVVFRAGRIEQAFHGNGESIFAWQFLRNGTEVAYRQGPLHFSDAEYFELRRVADGKLLATYEYPGEDEAQARARAKRTAPAWVKPIAEE
jgi:hypothetical protein